ncbi:DNA oxidative demethylase AlkB [Pseudohongiella nitratireducens]|uniref:DNA oxidative demethylase AlkB n=1 Tax=Pseudohongiella nitratireducens TaxID=1768907 RepID=UPI0030EDBCD7|tara:strand:+ start:7282 stop:7953 length:672 start_codon:yes stop_codon:yes gene_type:complete
MQQQSDFFLSTDQDEQLAIGPGAFCFKGAIIQDGVEIIRAVNDVVAKAEFRHLITPGGRRISVAMSNCGRQGWVSDHAGYRYQTTDPLTGNAWPVMPRILLATAQSLAARAGFGNFNPDVCLINRYRAGDRMGLHQDRDEGNVTAPIVSLSLGLPATFIWGGLQRSGPTQRFILEHGDAVVWGGEDRLRFHGVAPLKAGEHPLTKDCRINITFRQTGSLDTCR